MAVLIAPLESWALGLGEIEVRSALNQPLKAEIELLSLDKTAVGDISAALAPRAAFDDAGIDRPSWLTKLVFKVATRSDGSPYIAVTSEQPIREPFVDFLVVIDWPNGHLVREYTVLLDPPLFVEAAPPPVAAPAVVASPAKPPPREPAAAPSAVAPSGAAPAPAAGSTPPRDARAASVRGKGLEYGPVVRNDTLWSIAMQMRPDDSVTVQQVMMALLKSNPEAFYDNNVNSLKAGYVLRIADAALITAMSGEEAAREAQRQYERWLDAKQRKAAQAAKRPQGGAEDAAAEAGPRGSGEAGPHLRLVVPEAAELAQATAGGAGAAAAGAAPQGGGELVKLRTDLTQALEASEVTRQENAELRERLRALEEQLAAMQRLVTLTDNTLAALQGQAAAPATAAPEAAAPPPAAPEAVSTPPPPPVAEAPSEAEMPSAAEGIIADLLADPQRLAVAGGAAVALLALISVARRRRRAAIEGAAAPAAFEGAEAAAGIDEGAAVAAAAAADMDEAAGQGAETEEAGADESGFDLIQAEEDEIDILAEADVYLAYRRFDKAEELLKEALRSEPGRQDVSLKLLEVYAASGNAEDFAAQAQSLRASLGEPPGETWDKVVALGKPLLGSHPLFGGDGAAGGTAALSEEEASAAAASEAGLDDVLPDFDLDAELDASLSELKKEVDAMAALEDTAGGAAAGAEPFGELDDLSRFTAADDGGAAAAGETGGESSEAEDVMAGLRLDESPAESEEASLEGLSGLDFDLGSLDLAEERGAETAAAEEFAAPGAEEEVVEIVAAPAVDEEVLDLAADSAVGGAPEPLLAEEAAPAVGEDEDLNLDAELDGLIASLDDTPLAGDELFGATEAAGDTGTLEGFELPADEAARGAGAEHDLSWLSGPDAGETSGGVGAVDDLDSLISGEDEVSTKLDLARAYIDMGDQDSARSILGEVELEGSGEQQREAQELMRQIS